MNIKSALVIGMGESGKEAAILLKERGANVVLGEIKNDYETEKEASCEINYETFDNFMLEKPEPLKKGIKFTVHNLGAIKGTMRRTEIYEDR